MVKPGTDEAFEDVLADFNCSEWVFVCVVRLLIGG